MNVPKVWLSEEGDIQLKLDVYTVDPIQKNVWIGLIGNLIENGQIRIFYPL